MRKDRHSRAEYAQIYGCAPWQIGIAVRSGVDPNDAEAVKAWLKAHTKTRIYRPTLVQTADGNGAAPQARDSKKQQRSDSRSARTAGLNEGMKALRDAEADLSTRYMDAVARQDAGQIRFWREEWLTVFEQLRRVEEKNPEIEREKRESVRLSEVEKYIFSMISAFRRALDDAPERLAHKLIGLNVPQVIEELKRENEVILRHLKDWQSESGD